MALNFPTLEDVINRVKTDVKNSLPESNPYLLDSFISALIFAFGGRIHDSYLSQSELITQLFPDTATGEFLERWGSIFGITRNPATQASGIITATGIISSIIPITTILQSQDSISYSSTSSQTIASNTISVTSITRSGNTATVVTPNEHIFASNTNVTISGADQAQYNGTFLVTVLSETEFSYDVEGSPATPATGTIFSNIDSASIPVISDTVGKETNQIHGTQLTFSTPIAGVDTNAFVQFTEISGGTDLESDEELRARLLDRIRNPVANFNPAAIENQAKLVPGVTRVFVQRTIPQVGQVTIFFMRDDDSNSIPDSSEVQVVRDKIIKIYPSHSELVDLFVSAPTPVTVDFLFSTLTPNTTSMRAAIISNLDQFFSESVNVGEDIRKLAYDSVIFNTVDIETGESVQSFSLVQPGGDVTILAGEIGIFGSFNI